MRLTVGPRTYDLATRALVLGVHGGPEELVRQGADLVEDAGPLTDRPPPVPLCVQASGEAAVERAVRAGAGLIRLPAPTRGELQLCATAGVAVVVPADAVSEAAATGVDPDRMVPASLLVDVAGHACPMAATAVAFIKGARIVRTADVQGARRICDVLAAVLEAR